MYYQPVIIKINRVELSNIIKEENFSLLKLTILRNINNIYIQNKSKHEILDTDIYILKRNKNELSIGIKSIQETISKIYFKNSSLKIICILEANYLTHESQNALLKILEEPNENYLFILFTENTDSILETIVSRCNIIQNQNSQNIENDTNLKDKDIENFINIDYIERSILIDKLIKEKSEESFVLLVESLIKYVISKKNIYINKRDRLINELSNILKIIYVNKSHIIFCKEYLNILIFNYLQK